MFERALTMPLFRHPIASHLIEIATKRYRERFNGAKGAAQAA
jgi:hypothetical protein